MEERRPLAVKTSASSQKIIFLPSDNMIVSNIAIYFDDWENFKKIPPERGVGKGREIGQEIDLYYKLLKKILFGLTTKTGC